MKTEKQIQHVIQSSSQHQIDKAENKKLLLTEYVPIVGSEDTRMPSIDDPIPGIENGLYFKSNDYKTLHLCTEAEITTHLRNEIKNRSHYLRTEAKRGQTYVRDVEYTGGLKKHTYTMSPWMSNWYKKLPTRVATPEALTVHITNLMTYMSYEIHKLTDYEIIGGAFHNERIAHFEVYVSHLRKIDNHYELIRNKYKPEDKKRKYQMAGFGTIGVMRYNELAPKQVYSMEIVDTMKKTIDEKTQANGCLPPDYHVACKIDKLLLNKLVIPHGREAYTVEAKKWIDWRKSKLGETVEGRMALKDQEIALLKSQLETANKVSGITMHNPTDKLFFIEMVQKQLRIPADKVQEFRGALNHLLMYEKTIPNIDEFVNNWYSRDLITEKLMALVKKRIEFRGIGVLGGIVNFDAVQTEYNYYYSLPSAKPKLKVQPASVPITASPAIDAKQPLKPNTPTRTVQTPNVQKTPVKSQQTGGMDI